MAPIGFIEAKMDRLLPVSGAGLDILYSDASISCLMYTYVHLTPVFHLLSPVPYLLPQCFYLYTLLPNKTQGKREVMVSTDFI